ncbi:MAG: hypothetical protein GC131_04055 [Alphaproteobacteria bacterium]|nr:hypothetical protein [Alphaproteobacteria bacterium]
MHNNWRFMLAITACSIAFQTPAFAQTRSLNLPNNATTSPVATMAMPDGNDAMMDPMAMSVVDNAPAPDGGLVASAMAGGDDALANFGPSSGTAVGQRAVELRDEVLRLRASVNNNAGEFMQSRSNGAAGAVQYHSTVAAITARLQHGTTRGNPILLRQWDEADAALNEVTQSLTRLNSLSTAIASDASLSAFLLESIQAAFHLSGAIDEDHDQLALLRDEISRLIVQVDYLRNQVTDDVQRQTAYLTTERSNLQALALAVNRGELLGGGVGNRPVLVNTAPVMSLDQNASTSGFGIIGAAEPTSPRAMAALPSPDAAVAPSAGKLLVLVRFNKPVVQYEQQLAQAVSTTLDRRPNADFTIVAVTPSSGDSSDLARASEVAQRNAETIKRSLMQLGLSSTRIAVANTQAASAQSPEVHVYVR